MLRKFRCFLVLPLALCACESAAKKAVLPMEAWTRQMPQHQELVAGAGEWEGTVTMYMPGVPQQPVRAKESVEALGTHWIQSRFSCEFMGMPYVGTGCVGYDPATRKYVGTWIDSTNSYFALMEGEKNASGALVMRWKSPDDATGELVAHRSESVETASGRVMTFYKSEGAGTKSMVIEMHRKRG